MLLRSVILLVVIKASLFAPVLFAADGEVLYKRLCTSCHGYQGEGRSGLGPPLRDSAGVSGEISGLIQSIANGREGTLMVPFRRNMLPEELAAVITYVRRQFGGEPEAVVTVGDLP